MYFFWEPSLSVGSPILWLQEICTSAAAIWTFWMSLSETWSLQVVDLFASSLFLLVMVFLLLHRLVWPIMQRPLQEYSTSRSVALQEH
jgi:hypothetical protein